LARQIDIAGKSGTIYRYTELDEVRPQAPAGANYIVTAATDRGEGVVFVGETDNLSRGDWRGPLTEARARFEDVRILTRLNVRSAVRQTETSDLIDHHRPTLNADAGPQGQSFADAAAETGAGESGEREV